MFRGVVLVLTFAFVMMAALPAATSASHGAVHGERYCHNYESTEGLGEGCSMGSNNGGRTDNELYYGWYHETSSGGGGQGGGGGRDCRTYLSTGEQECDAGAWGR